MDHMRTGQGDMLQLQLRKRQNEEDAPDSKHASAQNAGTMTVTRYSLKQAEAFFENKLQPGLRTFSRIIKRLCLEDEFREAFFAAADKEHWFGFEASSLGRLTLG